MTPVTAWNLKSVKKSLKVYCTWYTIDQQSCIFTTASSKGAKLIVLKKFHNSLTIFGHGFLTKQLNNPLWLFNHWKITDIIWPPVAAWNLKSVKKLLKVYCTWYARPTIVHFYDRIIERCKIDRGKKISRFFGHIWPWFSYH